MGRRNRVVAAILLGSTIVARGALGLPDTEEGGETSCAGSARALGLAELTQGDDAGGRFQWKGDVLWRSSSSGLTSFDVSVPTAPRKLDFHPLDAAPVASLVVVGSTVAVPAGRSVLLFDGSDPAAIRYAGRISHRSACVDAACGSRIGLEASVRDVATDGTDLFAVWSASEGTSQFILIERWALEAAGTPRFVGADRIPVSGNGYLVLGGSAIAAGGGHLYVPYLRYDSVSDTAGAWRLRIVDAQSMAGTDLYLSSGVAPFRGPTILPDGLFVADGHLYLVDSANTRLTILDVTHPTSPKGCLQTPLGGAQAPPHWNRQKFYSFVPASGGSGSVRVYSTVDPCALAVVQSFGSATFEGVPGLATSDDGRYLFAGGLDGGVRAWDLLVSPHEIGSTSGASATSILSIESDATGRYAWSAITEKAGDSIVAWDGVDPAAPRRIATIPVAGKIVATARREGRLYAATDKELVIYDVASSPAAPIRVGSFPLSSGTPCRLVATPGRLAIGSSTSSGPIVAEYWNVENPSSPTRQLRLVSSSYPREGSCGVAFSGATAVMFGYPVEFWDVSSPLVPYRRGATWQAGQTYDGLLAPGGWIYAATSSGLAVIDARNPSDPEVSSSILLGSRVRRLKVDESGGTIRLASSGRIDVFDIASEPGVPRSVDSFPVVDIARDVAPGGDATWVAATRFVELADSRRCLAVETGLALRELALCAEDRTAGSTGGRLWSFGDGSSSVEARALHEFEGPGRFLVRLETWGAEGYPSVEVGSIVEAPSTTAGLPSVSISLPGGEDPVPAGALVHVELSGFELDCGDGGPAGPEPRGHYRVSIDGAPQAEGCDPWFALPRELSAAPHDVVVELVDASGQPLCPPALARRVVNVDEGPSPWIPRLVVPGVARFAGSGGSFYRSAAWTSALGDPSLVRYSFVASPGLGGPPGTVDASLSPGETLSTDDVLTGLFADSPDSFGNLVVSTPRGYPLPVVTARTYNDAGSSGTFGQYIRGVPILAPPPEAPDQVQWISSVVDGAPARSNLGVVNLSTDTPLVARVEVVDSSGEPRGTPIDVSVPPLSLRQVNAVARAAGLEALDPMSLRITGRPPFFSYVSQLDNRTSDPIFVPGDLGVAGRGWIDGLASAPGAGTWFRSDLSLQNRSDSPLLVVLAFTPRGESTPAATAELPLAAGESRRAVDVVRSLFGLEGMAGSLAFSTIPPDAPVAAWARTYADQGDAGTFGQFIPAFHPSDLFAEEGAILPGLRDDEAFRTNVGLVNVADVDLGVTLRLVGDDGGVVGSLFRVVPRQGSLFLAGCARLIAGGEAVSGRIEVKPGAAAAIYAWASMVDNVSSDPTFVRPVSPAPPGELVAVRGRGPAASTGRPAEASCPPRPGGD